MIFVKFILQLEKTKKKISSTYRLSGYYFSLFKLLKCSILYFLLHLYIKFFHVICFCLCGAW